MLVFWLGCSSDSGSSDNGSDSGATTPTFALGCRPDPENYLRAVCGFERSGTGPISATLTGGGEPPKVFAGDPDALMGEIVGWDLLAATRWDWTLTDRGTEVDSGSFVTDTLPMAYDPLVTVTVDGATEVDRVLFSMSCGLGPALFVLDADNRVRWYQDLGDYGFVSALYGTERGTAAAILDRSVVGEWAFDGSSSTLAAFPSDLPYRVHHAVDSVGTSLYALDAQTIRLADGLDYIVDGVTKVDDGLGTHLWDTTEIVDPIGLLGLGTSPYWLGTFGSSIDYAHTNSIDVQDDGSWIMSLKHLDAVARVNADGSLRWVISGEPSEATFYGPSVPLLSANGLETTFQHPHSVSLSPSGTVLVFDNGDVMANDPFSRVVELSVDEVALQAEVVSAWELGVVCPVQSSVYPLGDGSLLAACAATKELFELDAAGIRRRSSLSCRDGSPGNSFVRVQPLDW